jgi:molecular chaperone Hsp33
MTAYDVAVMGGREEDWNRATLLMQTAETHELIGPHLAMEELLYRLFHEERPMAYPAQTVEFGCTCTPRRVEAALAQYSAEDIANMTTEDGRVTADCQFCSAHYEFDPEALGLEATRNADGSVRE